MKPSFCGTVLMPCMEYNLEQVIALAFPQESENGLTAAGLAQMVECLSSEREVAGSIPTGPDPVLSESFEVDG